MKWSSVFLCIFIIFLMILYQWPQLKKSQKRDKAAFLSLSFAGLLLAILLIMFPDISGPTQMIDWLYKPLGKFLEK
ncbi:hypothetical protein [Neobacillus mesonae]|uniref:hypothetical protein n=1 Tax=Neobacillus mesonae TaxID=1193713 RepID=UPI00203B740A|nr:hypothetical protein [Neobacillus mesonae]MCM3569766.1 hypothetical protein [Neobacillus mesonae]